MREQGFRHDHEKLNLEEVRDLKHLCFVDLID